jgi:hypothetical protein
LALLTAQTPAITGGAMTYSAVNSSDTAVPGNNVFLHVKTVGTSTNVTVVVPGSVYGQARADVVVAVGTNTDRIIGPLVPDLADPTTGVVTISYSATTAVTSALLAMATG